MSSAACWKHGPVLRGGSLCRFRVWAPRASRLELHLLGPPERFLPLEPAADGYWEAEAEGAGPGTRYLYRLDGARERPDPASRFQPEGVHGPSEVVEPAFPWEDGAWHGLPLSQCVFYELHVGAFTPEGDFEAVIPHLDQLRDLGITALDLMPVAQFPGARNWGYDGVCPFAVQNSYGGPRGLKRLVNACHQRGLAVALDVVYNHLGPEGNYLAEFGPYFTDRYRTSWGPALNFDGPLSDPVRRFFIENALSWVRDFHIDALRLDAVHAIFDQSACPFLEELGDEVHREGERLNRRIHVVPESALNDPRLVRSKDLGGFGLDAQWNDDFHHALRTLLTGDRAGYYCDFGELGQLATAYRQGYVYSGQRSRFRRRRHGASSSALPAGRFVVFSHNHDQVGNRMRGERLSHVVGFESLKLAAAAVVLSPFLPLLFMGEEYAETAPFLYFVSHSDSELVEAVRRGRREEFASFAWDGDPPDPQAEETFLRSKLDHGLRGQGRHQALWNFYRELLRLRRAVPALSLPSKERLEVAAFRPTQVLFVRRWREDSEAFFALCFAPTGATLDLPVPAGSWRKLLDSSEAGWLGGGSAAPALLESEGTAGLSLSPHAVVLYARR